MPLPTPRAWGLCGLMILIWALALVAGWCLEPQLRPLPPSKVWITCDLVVVGAFSLGMAWCLEPLLQTHFRQLSWALRGAVIAVSFATLVALSLFQIKAGALTRDGYFETLSVVYTGVPILVTLVATYSTLNGLMRPRNTTCSVRGHRRFWILMAAIAVFSVFLYPVVLTGRAFDALHKAQYHAGGVTACQWFQGQGSEPEFPAGLRLPTALTSPEEREYYRTVERYHELMSQKYYAVARHPWFLVSPDRPEPEMPRSIRERRQKGARAESGTGRKAGQGGKRDRAESGTGRKAGQARRKRGT